MGDQPMTTAETVMIGVLVILLLVILWHHSPYVCRCGCRHRCMCAKHCRCKFDHFNNPDAINIYDDWDYRSAAGDPQAIDLGAASPGVSVRTDYMKAGPLSKYVVAEGATARRVIPPSQRYEGLKKARTENEAREDGMATGREAIATGRDGSDMQNQRFGVEALQKARDEADDFKGDSLDVTAGPVYWRNDPRDEVGTAKKRSMLAPVGSTDELRRLLGYMTPK